MAREAVWVEGQDKLFMNMDGLTADVEKAARRGLQRAGMRIIADAQRNMRTAGHNGATLNATGQLSNSGKVQDGENGTIDVGFFSTTSGTGYAAHVEYGTKAHWPPRWALRAWVRKKLRVPNPFVTEAEIGPHSDIFRVQDPDQDPFDKFKRSKIHKLL